MEAFVRRKKDDSNANMANHQRLHFASAQLLASTSIMVHYKDNSRTMQVSLPPEVYVQRCIRHKLIKCNNSGLNKGNSWAMDYKIPSHTNFADEWPFKIGLHVLVRGNYHPTVYIYAWQEQCLLTIGRQWWEHRVRHTPGIRCTNQSPRPTVGTWVNNWPWYTTPKEQG